MPLVRPIRCRGGLEQLAKRHALRLTHQCSLVPSYKHHIENFLGDGPYQM